MAFLSPWERANGRTFAGARHYLPPVEGPIIRVPLWYTLRVNWVVNHRASVYMCDDTMSSIIRWLYYTCKQEG